jgi:ribonuclease HI
MARAAAAAAAAAARRTGVPTTASFAAAFPAPPALQAAAVAPPAVSVAAGVSRRARQRRAQKAKRKAATAATPPSATRITHTAAGITPTKRKKKPKGGKGLISGFNPLQLLCQRILCQAAGRVHFATSLPAGVTADSTAEVRLRANMERYAEAAQNAPHWLLLTDGAVSRSRGRVKVPPAAGGAYILRHTTTGEAYSDQFTCAADSCSYTTELLALRQGLSQALSVLDQSMDQTGLVVLTDSQNALRALEVGRRRAADGIRADIWDLLTRLTEHGRTVRLCFVFAHCGWAAHNEVDRLAKAALRVESS